MIDKIMKLIGYEKLENIKIQEKFKKHPPNAMKMNKRKFYYYYNHHKKFYVPIVVNKNNILVDGYTSYLIAKEYKLKYVPVKRV